MARPLPCGNRNAIPLVKQPRFILFIDKQPVQSQINSAEASGKRWNPGDLMQVRACLPGGMRPMADVLDELEPFVDAVCADRKNGQGTRAIISAKQETSILGKGQMAGLLSAGRAGGEYLHAFRGDS